jgi:hypothetical protein
VQRSNPRSSNSSRRRQEFLVVVPAMSQAAAGRSQNSVSNVAGEPSKRFRLRRR